MSTVELSADEKAEVARFGIHDEPPRWKVACVNWPFPDAPHALTYVLIDGEACLVRPHATWEDAIVWLDESRDRLHPWAEALVRNRRGAAEGEDLSW
jgi:hypothetical protein